MKKILIIDDDRIFAKVLGEALIQEKFTLVEATNGVDGLTVFEKERPDFVVLDMKMPGLDGIGFLKQLCEKNENKIPTPILIVSNFSDLTQVSEGVSLGIKGYISKTEKTIESIVEDIKRILETEERLRQKTQLGK